MYRLYIRYNMPLVWGLEILWFF